MIITKPLKYVLIAVSTLIILFLVVFVITSWEFILNRTGIEQLLPFVDSYQNNLLPVKPNYPDTIQRLLAFKANPITSSDTIIRIMKLPSFETKMLLELRKNCNALIVRKVLYTNLNDGKWHVEDTTFSGKNTPYSSMFDTLRSFSPFTMNQIVKRRIITSEILVYDDGTDMALEAITLNKYNYFKYQIYNYKDKRYAWIISNFDSYFRH